MLSTLRAALLKEAESSPALLSDLAGLEEYISESYDSRSFVELLQNADDAGARRFAIVRYAHLLLVANDGRLFTQADLEALCRSAASAKARGQTIGYRGIGFKSVVGFADAVHLITGDIALTFSRERTRQALPMVSRVPLIRIPHPLTTDELLPCRQPVDDLLAEGYQTIFVFDSSQPGRIENELVALDGTSLLFLRSIERVDVRSLPQTRSISVQRRRTQSPASVREVQLLDGNSETCWRIYDANEVALAFRTVDNVATKLDESDAVVHAFLPTHEPTGFGFKVQGDFSTDPSRTRVVFDQQTCDRMEAAARLLLELIESVVNRQATDSTLRLEQALAPTGDARMASFQRRSFRTEFYTTLRRMCAGRLEELRIRPAWLNGADFAKLSAATRLKPLDSEFEAIDHFVPMLKFLGFREAVLEDFFPALPTVVLSSAGGAEVVSQLTQRWVTGQSSPERTFRVDWKLWPNAGRMLALSDLRSADGQFDQPFLDLLQERGRLSDVRTLLSRLVGEGIARLLIPALPAVPEDAKSLGAIPAGIGALGQVVAAGSTSSISLKKWRGAEQQVLGFLSSSGWTAKDVSRQNVGYDIEATSPTGDAVFVEVKSIDYPGQPFTLTSNEEAVAREKGSAYQLAIVRTSDAFLEIAFISDPANEIALTRQCRQWVWECSHYPFAPIRIPLT